MSSERPVILSMRRIDARGRRQQPREVARAVADHRQRFLGERGEHQLARARRRAAPRRSPGSTISGIEMVFPDDRPVLGLDALVGDARAHHFGQPVDVDRVDPGALLDRRAHRVGPRLGAEDADLERAVGAGRMPCRSISSAIASM